MKSLNAQMMAFKKSVLSRADDGLRRALVEAEAEYRRDAAAARPLGVGDTAPSFSLPDSDRRRRSLGEFLARGPVLLVFIRGGWCPYCTLFLRALEEITAEVAHAGGSIVGLTPQKTSRVATMRDSNGLSFPILTDAGNRVAAEFGVVGEALPMTRLIFDKLGCNIPEENEAGGWLLPRAAEFLIDGTGVIRMSHVSPVSSERTEPQEALAALRALGRSMAKV